MCGIAGVVSNDPRWRVSEAQLRRMTAAMIHRGPDDEGYYLNDHVGLGFRRLSIIDLDGGHQPVANEDHSYWAVFNGEIYNFMELRAALEARGHRFRSRSDSEVLVHLYQEYGARCVDHLRGMYAFAIYDVVADRVFLARDRFGKKPLYYTNRSGKLIFGSELKVVLAAGDVDRTIDPAAVASYFTYGYVAGSRSIFDGIRKCPPGHFVEYDRATGRLREERYWSPHFAPDFETSEQEWIERIHDSLAQAVGSRLVSDVPLGAFLSGGIDSSIVVAMMAAASERPVKTFSIGFKEEAYSELEFARQVAQRYGTEHHEQILDPESVDLLPRIVRAFDEPFADASAIPTYYVAKFAREHVTVCLSGDGGDELFAGYNDYQKQLRLFRYNRLPRVLNRMVWGRIHRALPDRVPGKGSTYLLAQDRRFSPAYFSVFTVLDRRRLFGPAFRDALAGVPPPEAMKEALLREFSGTEYLSSLQNLDIATWLVDDVLCKVDRMSMLNSLEVRSPLLDQKFAELAFRIPASLRIRGGDKKYILKRAAADLLPPAVLSHRKQGFGVPLKVWFRSDLKEYVHDRLLAGGSRLGEYLDMDFVRQLVNDHDAGMRDLNRKVWAVLVFDAWLQEYA